MTAKIRLSATSEESNNWVTFFKALESASVIRLLEISDNYSNRGNSQYQRVYLEADLLVDIEAVGNRLDVRPLPSDPTWVLTPYQIYPQCPIAHC